MNVGDLVKIKGTRETYELGLQHRVGKVVAVKAGGEIVHVALDGDRIAKLSIEEVCEPDARDVRRRPVSPLDGVDVFLPRR